MNMSPFIFRIIAYRKLESALMQESIMFIISAVNNTNHNVFYYFRKKT